MAVVGCLLPRTLLQALEFTWTSGGLSVSHHPQGSVQRCAGERTALRLISGCPRDGTACRAGERFTESALASQGEPTPVPCWLSQEAGLQGPAKSQGQGFLACPREGDSEDDGGCG